MLGIAGREVVLDPGRWLLRQCGRRVGIIREMTEGLARSAWWPLVHTGLVRHLGRHLGRHLREMRRGVLGDILRWVVWWQRIVRPLTAHSITRSSHIGLRGWNRRTEITIGHMRRTHLRASVGTSHIIGCKWRLTRTHTIAWNERLCLGIEGMTVVTTWDGMLTLRIVRVRVRGKLAISVRNAVHQCHIALRLRCLWATGLVRARRRGLVDGWLPRLGRRCCLYRRSVRPHRSVG